MVAASHAAVPLGKRPAIPLWPKSSGHRRLAHPGSGRGAGSGGGGGATSHVRALQAPSVQLGPTQEGGGVMQPQLPSSLVHIILRAVNAESLWQQQMTMTRPRLLVPPHAVTPSAPQQGKSALPKQLPPTQQVPAAQLGAASAVGAVAA